MVPLSKSYKSSQRFWSYALMALILLSVGLFAWAAYDSRYILNPDGISYMSIAKQYADGHFYSALSTLLPPLLSWLLIPFIKVGISGQLAFFALNFLAAVGVLLIGIYLLLKKSKSPYLSAIFYTVLMTPFLVHAIGYSITPDLLVMLWVMVFYITLLRADRWLSDNNTATLFKSGALLGTIGALGYFTKQFIFPFFFASLFLWTSWRLLAAKKSTHKLPRANDVKQAAIHFGVTMLFFGAVAAPWISAISAKHQSFTFGTSIGATFSRFDQANGDATSPSSQITLYDPPSQYAVSYQECRGCFKSQVPQTVGSSRAGFDLGHFVSAKAESFPRYFNRLNSIGWFILPVTVLFIFLVVVRKLTYKNNPAETVAGLLLVIYLFGYAVTLSAKATSGTSRYLWPLFVLAGLLFSLLFSRLLIFLDKNKKSALLTGLAITMGVIVSASISYKYRQPLGDLLVAPQRPLIRSIAENIKNKGIILPGSKLASNNPQFNHHLAYYLESQTYGSISATQDGPKFTDPGVQAVLKNKEIDYFIYYSTTNEERLEINGAKIMKQYGAGSLCLDAKHTEDCTMTVLKLSQKSHYTER